MNQKQFDISYLPRNPLQFFGLDENFEHRDLKRAYGQAIRKYRPESVPVDFQLVRSAYEYLEAALNTNTVPKNSVLIDLTPLGITETSGNVESTNLQEASREPDLLQIAILDPIAAIEKLRAKGDLSPNDYINLAIFSDLTPNRSPFEFLKYLLQGFSEFPENETLFNLIQTYLQHDVQADQIGKASLLVAKSLRSYSFYSLTAPLWIRNFRTQPAAKVVLELSECESYILVCPPAIAINFNLEILPTAAWTADVGWVRSRIDEMDPNSSDFPEFLENYHQYVIRQIAYILGERDPKRRSRIENEYISKARKHIRALGISNDPHREEDCFQFFLNISERSSELCNLPLNEYQKLREDPLPDCFLFMGALSYTADKLLAEFRINNEFDMTISDPSIRDLIDELQYNSNWYNILSHLPNVLIGLLVFTIAILTLVCAFFISLQLKIESVSSAQASIATFSVLAGCYLLFLRPHVKRFSNRLQMSISSRLYKVFWRPILFSFFRANPMDVERLLSYLKLSKHTEKVQKIVDQLNYQLPLDDALQLFACSQRFRI